MYHKYNVIVRVLPGDKRMDEWTKEIY